MSHCRYLVAMKKRQVWKHEIQHILILAKKAAGLFIIRRSYMYHYLSWVLLTALMLGAQLSTARAQSAPLSIAVLISSGQQRSTFNLLVNQFKTQHPGIQVDLLTLSDAELKTSLVKWLASGAGPDIINWQAGERLYQYVRQGKIRQLDSLWQKLDLAQSFTTASAAAITLDQHRYAIPLSYYQWGFYYRKSLFAQYKLTVPETWAEFLQVSENLKSHGVVPITIGNKNQWPAAAWFDYLNLRINGLKFHSALLRGEISFTDERVVNIFQAWSELLTRDFFVDYHSLWDWSEAMPFIYHKKAGMTLIGNFFSAQIPDVLTSDIGFFRFPIIDESVPVYEEAPMDVFMMPAYAKPSQASDKFLKFVAGAEFQQAYSQGVGLISPNVNVAPSSNYYVNKGKETLQQAQGLSQYFDRDTNAQMSEAASKLFARFIAQPDIGQVTRGLEDARQQYLLN